MKTILEILEAARALPRCAGAAARNADGDPVHALSPPAAAWDPCGALHKVLGVQDGDDYVNALRCLGVGAARVTGAPIGPFEGIVEVVDSGNAGLIHNMWRIATQAARQVEVQMAMAA